VIQAKKGYRVSEDSLLLAWFVRPSPNEAILDAGTGCGAIAFALAAIDPSLNVVGLEIQAGLADRAARGRRLNNVEARVLIVRGDVRRANRFIRPSVFDCVVSNPPFHEFGKGRVNVRAEKALARHQLMLPTHELLHVSKEILKPEGRICLIYPASGVSKLRASIERAGFKLSRVVWIQTRRQAQAGLACLEARLADRPLELLQESLVLYGENGRRTEEAEAILAGEYISADL
jgi:tRNA1Val (adenine37-N6)-methyltransferase